MSLPRRIRVSEVLSSRYQPGARPVSWDERTIGLEQVKTEVGESLNLYSNGGQSSPDIGWELLLTEELQLAAPEPSLQKAYSWTLYGIKPKKNAL